MGTAIQENRQNIKAMRKQLEIIETVMETLENNNAINISNYNDLLSVYLNKQIDKKTELKKLRIQRYNLLKIS